RAEGEVLDEHLALSRRTQRLVDQVERDAVLRVERKRPPVLRDGLVPVSGLHAVAGRLDAQQRRAARVLAAAREPAAQVGPQDARLAARVVSDELQQRGSRLQVSGRLGEDPPVELRRLDWLGATVRLQRGGPAQRLDALGGERRPLRELLVSLRGL